MKKIKSVVLLLILMLSVTSFLPVNITPMAEKVEGSKTGNEPTELNFICKLMPSLNESDFTKGLCGGSDVETVETVKAYATLGLSTTFVGIIISAVIVIIKAAIKYIQSEGEAEKVESSQKAIKSVFVGIGALFVGILGLIMVVIFFGGTGLLNPETGGITSNPIVDDLL